MDVVTVVCVEILDRAQNDWNSRLSEKVRR